MGKYISELSYEQLQACLTEDTVVMLPIGGGAKEHGGHLPMGTDMFVTDYVARRITESRDILTLPILPYAYFPAFVNWKGSVSIPYRHFTDFVEDILLTYVRCGIKKFLILDGGVSTHPPLCLLARDMFNNYGVTVAVSDIRELAYEEEITLCTQKRGGHGDEGETSTMLVVRPELVDMDKTTEEYNPMSPGVQNGRLRVYVPDRMTTPKGTNGNSTLATKAKGEKILDAMVNSLCRFLDSFHTWTPCQEGEDA